MDLGLADKVVVVAGASEGMGRATAQVLAGEGARLALVARSQDTLEKVAADCAERGAADAVAMTGDFTDAATVADAVAEVAKRFGSIYGLVNTIGLCEPVPDGILAEDDGYWERSFQSVLMAAVRACRATVPVMLANGGGAIVNISAMSARHYLPILSHYSAMKVALAHFTKNLAKEYAAQGIRANAVMPGMIESEGVAGRKAKRMAEEGWDENRYFAYVQDKYDRPTFADRLGTPTEIANAVAFLLSPKASYVNGAWLPVDGGSVF
jgi:NAD(P)-dependent dehydrogenase (short-subunit alcohol dehydrogenase family)